MKVWVYTMDKIHTQQSMEKSGFLIKRGGQGREEEREREAGGREGYGRGPYTLKDN